MPPGWFVNIEALGKPFAPEGFNPGPPSLRGFIEFGDATSGGGGSAAE
jgi:hypothetical protein